MRIVIADPKDGMWVPVSSLEPTPEITSIKIYHFDDDTGLFDEKDVPKHVRELAQRWMMQKQFLP